MLLSPPLLPSFGGSSRRGLLIDLDNIALHRGRLLPADLVGQRLRTIAELAGPCDYRIAIAPPRTLGAYSSVLVAQSIPVRTCGSEPDAADLALCVQGFELLARGYAALVVASGDHFFAQLADLAPLHLAVPHDIPVARSLKRVARPVAHFPARAA